MIGFKDTNQKPAPAPAPQQNELLQVIKIMALVFAVAGSIAYLIRDKEPEYSPAPIQHWSDSTSAYTQLVRRQEAELANPTPAPVPVPTAKATFTCFNSEDGLYTSCREN